MAATQSGDVNKQMIEFSVALEPTGSNALAADDFDQPTAAAAAQETPLQRAVRLVRQELDNVESRNQLNHYLMAFDVSILQPYEPASYLSGSH